MQTSEERLNKLRKDTNQKIDKLQGVFTKTKAFSKNIDLYIRKISNLVTNILDVNIEEEQAFIMNYRSDKGKFTKNTHSTSRNNTINDKMDQIYQKEGQEEKNVYNSVPADFLQTQKQPSLNDRDQPIKKESFNKRKGNPIFDHFQMHNNEFKKMIDSGEFNARNLKEVVNQLFNSKIAPGDEKVYKEKIDKLKKKVSKLKLRLEEKEAENQNLRIDLSVSQNLKKELETLQTNLRKDINSSFNSNNTSKKACWACEKWSSKTNKLKQDYEIIKNENSFLTSQLEYSQNKLIILNKNVEMMNSEFFELYKNVFYKLNSNYQSYQERSQFKATNGSDTNRLSNRSPDQFNSNYNTLSDKFNGLGNFLADGQNLIEVENYEQSSNLNSPEVSPQHRNQHNSLDYKYSTVTEQVQMHVTCKTHNEFCPCDCVSQKRPCTDYKKHKAEADDDMYTSESKNHSSVPLNYILEKNKEAVKKRLKEMGLDDLQVPKDETGFRLSASEGNMQKLQINVDLSHVSNQIPSPAFNEHVVESDVINENDKKEPVFYGNDSDERMSLVEMSNSIENSLDNEDSHLDPNKINEEKNLARISFGNKEAIQESIVNTNKVNTRSSQEIGEIKKGDIYDNNDEDPNILKPNNNKDGFYTFSQKANSDIYNSFQ